MFILYHIEVSSIIKTYTLFKLIFLPSRELGISPYEPICSPKFYSTLSHYFRVILFYAIEISTKINNHEPLLTNTARMP